MQQDAFPQDVARLSAGKVPSNRSRLRQLSPCLDGQGVIRLQGRIGRAVGVVESAKQPVILDPDHQYTRLLVNYVHVKAGHHGQATVLNELRQRFWILRGRFAVRRSWSTCQYCCNRRSQPQVPPMGNLPASRLTPNVRPFSITGVDYFGPMDVRVGRRTEKRYGVLFTCMVTRAIHIELANSLTTDSCIMAIRRFHKQTWIPSANPFRQWYELPRS